MRWLDDFLGRSEERAAQITYNLAEADRLERRQEREAFMTALAAMVQVSTEASKASAAQAGALQAFLNGFITTSAPTSRVLTEEDDYRRYMTEHDKAEVEQGITAMKGILDDPFAD